MEAGKLRNQITFQQKTIPEPLDSFNNPQEVWVDAWVDFAAFEPIGSAEFPRFEKRFAETTARFRMRYRPGIDPDQHRIVFGLNYQASPVVVSIWNIAAPIVVKGRPFEMYIEANEIK